MPTNVMKLKGKIMRKLVVIEASKDVFSILSHKMCKVEKFTKNNWKENTVI